MGESRQTMTAGPPRLLLLEDRLAICRLDPRAELPDQAPSAASFFSLTRTPDELSVVCPEDSVPDGVAYEGGWRVLKLEGSFGFGEVGVLASVAEPLAKAGISIFTISTYDTDHVLVKAEQLERAISALRERGHEVG